MYLYSWAYDLKPTWGGTKFLPEKFVTKYAIKRVSKQMLTFFFYLFIFFGGDVIAVTNFSGKNVRTLTQIARKIKSCPKFLQPGGASAPPDPPLRTPMPILHSNFSNTLYNLTIMYSKSDVAAAVLDNDQG